LLFLTAVKPGWFDTPILAYVHSRGILAVTSAVNVL